MMFGSTTEPKPTPHVCDEFTRWQRKQIVYTRAACAAEIAAGITGWVKYTQYWQERECTVCGLVEQKALNYGPPPPVPEEIESDTDDSEEEDD